ncbi:MAG: DNA topoisomerase IB [Gemmataceae bacterium]
MSAKLNYVSDTTPGVQRLKVRTTFRYVGPAGKPLRDVADLARITALAIPPAWADVWICPSCNGHIQATGRDARGRKQYRYHAHWRQARDGTKFGQLVAFGRVLPKLRRQVATDLARPGLPREKVLAAVVRLLDATKLRVGNAEYARTNKSFGLSTLLDRHVQPTAGGLRLKFRGKSGVWHERRVSDRRLATVVKRCRDLPGQDLFQYLDDNGEQRTIGSADVNEYIRAAAGAEFTAKVFRTWVGTVAATVRLAGEPVPETKAAAKRAIVAAIQDVAAELGNTPAVCRASYVHPAALTAFEAGELKLPRKRVRGLSADEATVLGFLRQADDTRPG